MCFRISALSVVKVTQYTPNRQGKNHHFTREHNSCRDALIIKWSSHSFKDIYSTQTLYSREMQLLLVLDLVKQSAKYSTIKIRLLKIHVKNHNRSLYYSVLVFFSLYLGFLVSKNVAVFLFSQSDQCLCMSMPALNFSNLVSYSSMANTWQSNYLKKGKSKQRNQQQSIYATFKPQTHC